MLQLDVKMRTLRDTVAYRHFAEPLGEDDEDMGVGTEEHECSLELLLLLEAHEAD